MSDEAKQPRRRCRILQASAILALPIALWFGMVVMEGMTGGIPVLMYHGTVENDSQAGRYEIPLSRLEEALEVLQAKGYTTITDRELIAAHKGGELPTRPVMLTFDDGSADHYAHVFPLLKKHGMTAVFFVITSRFDTPGFLTESQVVEMHRAGMSIQSHSISAQRLTEMLPDEAYAAMTQSRAALEQVLKTQPLSFCLPGGAYNGRILEQLDDAGYGLVFTSDVGTNPRRKAGQRVRRLEMSGTLTIDEFSFFDDPSVITGQRLKQIGKRLVKRFRKPVGQQ